jgi:sugar lactone lactonase YvrE
MADAAAGSGTRIFISYRRGDTSGYAGRLSDDLRDHVGVAGVFRDIDTIDAGADFGEAITEAVASCHALVAIIGREWLTSQDKNGRRRLDDPEDFVRLEIAAALERGIVVMPVLVENTQMPAVADLPAQLAPLARRNAIDVSDSRWNYDVSRLLERIESLRQPEPAPSAAEVAPAVPAAPAPAEPAATAPAAATTGDTGWARRTLVRWRKQLLGLVVALVALAVVVTVFLPDGSDDDEFPTGQGPAQLSRPGGLAFREGALYVADYGHKRIVRLTPAANTVVAGTGEWGTDGDGGPATSATLADPVVIALDAAGNLYVSDWNRGGIRKVSADGEIDTVVIHSPGVGTLKVEAMAVGPDGALLLATDREVLKVGPDGTLIGVAGSADKGFAGDGGPATSAKLDSPKGLAVDAANNIYIADAGNFRIRKIGADGNIVTIAGTGKDELSGEGGPAVEANISTPSAIAVDSQGVLYVAIYNRVGRIGTDGRLTPFAGNDDGISGFSGDGGPARAARLEDVVAMAVDPDGNLYLSDSANDRVRRIAPNGTIATIA